MILASGKKGYRYALPNSRIMTCPPRMNRCAWVGVRWDGLRGAHQGMGGQQGGALQLWKGGGDCWGRCKLGQGRHARDAVPPYLTKIMRA
jgi:hypothetical protein